MNRIMGCAAALIAAMTVADVANAAAIFSDRSTFEGALSTLLTDDYSAPGYDAGDELNLGDFDIHTDANMNSIFGETLYTTTSAPDINYIVRDGGNPYYCVGCNGSFLLDFSATSIGTPQGVFGVGFDIAPNEEVFGTIAFVTFGDGSTANFVLPENFTSNEFIFWGITDPLLIQSIHFGLIDGAPNIANNFQRMAIDNLTIGAAAVPEPATLALVGAGLAGMGVAARRRRKT